MIASKLIHNPTGATGSVYRWTVQDQGVVERAFAPFAPAPVTFA